MIAITIRETGTERTCLCNDFILTDTEVFRPVNVYRTHFWSLKPERSEWGEMSRQITAYKFSRNSRELRLSGERASIFCQCRSRISRFTIITEFQRTFADLVIFLTIVFVELIVFKKISLIPIPMNNPMNSWDECLLRHVYVVDKSATRCCDGAYRW